MNTPLQAMVYSRLGSMQIYRTHGSVVGHGVTLGEVVCPVAFTFVPVLGLRDLGARKISCRWLWSVVL
jgi:hypothetical protein